MKRLIKILLLAVLVSFTQASGAFAAYCTVTDKGISYGELVARNAAGTCDPTVFYSDIGLIGLLEFETARVEPDSITVWLASDGYFAGAICTPSAAGNVKFYDIGTATTTGATLILEFGLPNVASQPFTVTLPGNAIKKFDTGLVASTTAAVMCYGLYRDEP